MIRTVTRWLVNADEPGQPRVCGVLMLLFTAAGLASALIGALELRHENDIRSEGFVPTTGTVTRSTSWVVDDGFEQVTKRSVHYQYTDDKGRVHESRTEFAASGLDLGFCWVRGAPINVEYRQDQPQVHRTAPGHFGSKLAFLVSASCLGAVGLVRLCAKPINALVRILRKGRRSSSARVIQRSLAVRPAAGENHMVVVDEAALKRVFKS